MNTRLIHHRVVAPLLLVAACATPDVSSDEQALSTAAIVSTQPRIFIASPE